MTASPKPQPFASLPSVDRLLGDALLVEAAARHGRDLVLQAVREVVQEARDRLAQDAGSTVDAGLLAREAAGRAERWMRPAPRRVFNLTGTVLHTNLGRSPLPEDALAALGIAAGASDVEFDLAAGKRGERDANVEAWLRRLIGAESAIVVNNNAAAVLLVLNSLAQGKEVPVSRGELVEIGGAFRMPDIMKRAGCKLVEVGTTNRTHARDFDEAVGDKTAMLMKVSQSNYEIHGFTAMVPDRDLAVIAHKHGKPFFVDLGSGSLVKLEDYGLPHEPTPQEALADGADIVSFSGDKLLGGPQVGVIVGKRELLAKIRRNPLLRALRVDKLRLAALSAVLRLYARPEQLVAKVPALRLLTRPQAQIEALAARAQPLVAARLGEAAKVDIAACASQVGSGAHPTHNIPSSGLRIAPAGRASGQAINALARRFRALPVPVIGHVDKDALVLDFRCLEDADFDTFTAQLAQL